MSVLVEVGLVLTLSRYCRFGVFIVSQDHHFYKRKGSSFFNYQPHLNLKTVTTWCSHDDSAVLRQSLEAWCCVNQASRQQPSSLSHMCAYCGLVGTLVKLLL